MDKDSNIYINLFSKYSTYMDTIKNINNQRFKNIVRTLFVNFINGYRWSGDKFKYEYVHISKYENTNKHLYKSKYVDTNIDTYVNKYIKYKVTYMFNIGHRNITINIATHNKLSDELYSKWIKQIMAWIYVAQIYARQDCGINLNIDIVMTNLKKCMPKKNAVVGVNNVNSGLSNSCQRNSIILIYRKEEWFKVLIHEIFHNFGLDFSHNYDYSYNNILDKHLNIKTNILLFETYTEFWARIINCIHNSMMLNKLENDFNNFFEYFYILLHFERMLSMYQCVKILSHQNMSYKDIFRHNNYNEKTNVFAYYIGVSILMDDPVNYILHQNGHTFSLKLEHVESFYNYFIHKAISRQTIQNFDRVSQLIDKMYIKNNRMSLSL